MSKSDVRKNVKRLFAMFLALAMVLTLLPAAVMAEGEELADAAAVALDNEPETDAGDGIYAASDMAVLEEEVPTEPSAMEPSADVEDEEDLDTAPAPVAEAGDTITVSVPEAGYVGDSVRLDLGAIKTVNAPAVKWTYEFPEDDRDHYHLYQIGQVGGGTDAGVQFVFTDTDLEPTYYKKDKSAGATNSWEKATVAEGKVTGIVNGDLVMIRNEAEAAEEEEGGETATVDYVVVMVLCSAEIDLDIMGDPAKDKVSFKSKVYIDDTTDKVTDGTSYTIYGDGVSTEVGPDWITDRVFDIKGAAGAEEGYEGDVITFTVTPGAGRRAVVEYLTGTATDTKKETITAASTSKDIVVTLEQSKLYGVAITFETIPPLSVTEVEGNNITTYRVPDADVETVGFNMDVYFIKAEDNTVTLTFNDDAEDGAITATVGDDDNNVNNVTTTDSATTNSVTVTGYKNGEIYTFTRSGATYRVRFYQSALVLMSLAAGSETMGTVEYKFVDTANPENAKNSGTLNASKTSYGELLDDNDTVELTFIPNTGFKLNSVKSNGVEIDNIADNKHTFNVKIGEEYIIVVEFGAAPPAATPNAKPGKGTAADLISLTTGLSADGSTGIYAIPGDLDVAYEMYVAGNLTGLTFPGLPEGTKYMQADAEADEWTDKGAFNGTVDITDRGIILFYTGYNNWIKVRVVQSALVTINAIGTGEGKTLTYQYASDKNDANDKEPAEWTAPTREWLDFGGTFEGNYVEIKALTDGKVAATSNGTSLTATDADGKVFKVPLTAAGKYDIVVTFADLILKPDDLDDEEMDPIEDGATVVIEAAPEAGQIEKALELPAGKIEGDVTFSVPGNVTLNITDEVTNSLSVTNSGKVAVNTVAPAAGKKVEVGNGGTIEIKTDLTLRGTAGEAAQKPAVTVTTGGTLTIDAAAGLDVTEADVTVDGTLTINSNSADNPAAISSGGTLKVNANATVEIGQDAALDIKDGGTATVDGTLKLGNNSKINVTAGAMSIGGSGGALEGTGAVITVGGTQPTEPAARTFAMDTFVDAAGINAVLTFTETKTVSVEINIKADGEVAVAAGKALTVNGTYTNAGKVLLNEAATLMLDDGKEDAGLVVDGAEHPLKRDSAGKYITRESITLEIKNGTESSVPGLQNMKDIVIGNLLKDDYVVYNTTASIDGKSVTTTHSLAVDKEGSMNLSIGYTGGSQVTVFIYGSKPGLAGGETVGAPNFMQDTK